MAYLLFFGYLALFLLLIPRIGFFKKSGLTPWQLRILFLIKVAAGVAYGYIYSKWGGRDTLMYHRFGLEEMALLRSDPLAFITSLADPGYSTGYGVFFGTINSWWNDLDGRFFGKTLALCNFLSGSNYYINSAFFNLFSFTGIILLFKVWKHLVPDARPLLLFAPFLFPSFLFWSSGIHKENLLVLALGMVVYSIYFGLQQTFSFKKVAAIGIGFLLVFMLRNYLLLPLAGALLGWVLAHRLQQRFHPFIVFSATYLLLAFLFFSSRYLLPALDLPQVVTDRQEAFSKLGSKNRLEALFLEPTATSFIKNTPAAFARAAFRPLPQDVNNLFSAFSAAESIVLAAGLFASLLLSAKSRWRNPYLLFCLFFCVSVLVIIGYTIIFPGAMVRYRSIVLPLLLMPPLAIAYRHTQAGLWLKKSD